MILREEKQTETHITLITRALHSHDGLLSMPFLWIYFQVNAKNYQVNGIYFKVNEKNYQVNGNYFKVNEKNYQVNENYFKVNEKNYQVNGNYFKVNEKNYQVNGNYFKVNEIYLIENGSIFNENENITSAYEENVSVFFAAHRWIQKIKNTIRNECALQSDKPKNNSELWK